jgi:hypothetical protein
MCADFIAFLQMLARATDGYIGSPHPPRYLRTQWCRARWALDGSTPRCVALTLSAARSLSHLRRSVHKASFPQLNSQGMKSLISVRMRTRTSMPTCPCYHKKIDRCRRATNRAKKAAEKDC